MAILIRNTPGDDGFDMRTLNFDNLIAGMSVTAFNPFIIQWKPATGTNVASLLGDGLNPTVSGGALTGLTGTTITQLTVNGDDFSLNIAGMSGSVTEFFDLVQDNDWKGLAEYVRQGNDTITGTKNDDTLLGGDGNDRFVAGPGRDYMNGGAGSDTLIASGEHDVMIGGKGQDVFEFDETPEPDEWDAIKDFKHGVDKIWVHDTGFNHVGNGGFDGAALDASHFDYGKQAKTLDQGLIYDKAKGFLYYDSDGSGEFGHRVLIAKMGAGTDLSFADFWVV